AGDLVSASFRIEPIDPVALATGGLTAKVTPPRYVNPDVIMVAEHAGYAPFRALQYSRLHFEFVFDRPAHKASVRWRIGDAPREPPLTHAASRVTAPRALLHETPHRYLGNSPCPCWSLCGDVGARGGPRHRQQLLVARLVGMGPR